MSGYLLCVIGTVLLASLITAIAPEGKTSSSVKGVAKLVCLLAIISPVLRFLQTGSLDVFIDKNGQEIFSQEGIEAEETFIQYYSELRVQNAESSMKKELLERYALVCEVVFDWNMGSEIQIQRICVKTPKDTDEEVKKKMRLYLTEKYFSEVLIE